MTDRPHLFKRAGVQREMTPGAHRTYCGAEGDLNMDCTIVSYDEAAKKVTAIIRGTEYTLPRSFFK